MKRDRRDDCDAEHNQAVRGERDVADDDRTLQRRRRGDWYRVAAPYDETEIGDDERDTQRDQHLSQRVAGETAQNQSFEQAAKHRDEQSSDQRGKPKVRYE